MSHFKPASHHQLHNIDIDILKWTYVQARDRMLYTGNNNGIEETFYQVNPYNYFVLYPLY